MFENQYIGIQDKNGFDIHNGDEIIVYHKGDFVKCCIVYVPEWGMFAVKWPDGYINKWPIHNEKIEVVQPGIFKKPKLFISESKFKSS